MTQSVAQSCTENDPRSPEGGVHLQFSIVIFIFVSVSLPYRGLRGSAGFSYVGISCILYSES
jgi:hypothetical protein